MVFSSKIKWTFIGMGLAVALIIWRIIFSFPPAGLLEVCFFDVGHGDAMLIDYYNGNQVLIDGGPGDKIKNEIGKCQPFYDKKIEAVVLTHPHYDHLSGILWVLENYKVEMVLVSGAESDSHTYQNLKNILKEKEISAKVVRAGQSLYLGKEIQLAFLYPEGGKDLQKLDNLNDASIISRLVYASSSFIFTGDAEAQVQKKLLQSTTTLQADILKVPHQGSRDAAVEDFVERVAPKVAVLCAGDNSYGHPHEETLRLYRDIRLLRTDYDGTIRVLTDGKRWQIITDRNR